jgi:hypothetical protein
MPGEGPLRSADARGKGTVSTVAGPVPGHDEPSPVTAGEAVGITRLEQVLEELAAGLSRLSCPDAEDALDDIDSVHEEMALRDPDRRRLAELMDRITSAVIPVAGLLQLARQADDLIQVIAS